MPLKIVKNKGILFWITGLSGSGKTSIAKKIKKEIIKKYGPTIIVSGDNFRKIFKFNSYTSKDREKYLMNYLIFAKFITDQNINLIFNLVGMYDRARKWNRKNIYNYLEIYIKNDIKKIIQFNKKKIYKKKIKNIVGIDIKAEYPKTPHIIINNNFTKSIDFLSKELIKKISKKIPTQK